jgi:hypothetical protein
MLLSQRLGTCRVSAIFNILLRTQAAVRVKHSDLIGASSGGIPVGDTNNSRFAAAALIEPGSGAGGGNNKAWGGGGDDDLSDIDLSEENSD